MTDEIWLTIAIFAAIVIVIAWPIACGLAALGNDVQREFEQEQSDERSERKR